MIEVSFVNEVMQLSQGYVDVLKLFIVAVQSGYSPEIPPTKLQKIVDQCPVQSANRPLMPEEIELRKTWMHIVYLVLDFVEYQGKSIADFSESSCMDSKIEDLNGKCVPILALEKKNTVSCLMMRGFKTARMHYQIP